MCGASAPVLSPSSAAEEEEEEEESPAGKLETVEVTLGTLDLREFEVMPKQNRKRRKKRNKRMENGEGEGTGEGTAMPEVLARLPHHPLPLQGSMLKRQDAVEPRVGRPSWSWLQSCRGNLGLSPFPGRLQVSRVGSLARCASALCAGYFAVK